MKKVKQDSFFLILIVFIGVGIYILFQLNKINQRRLNDVEKIEESSTLNKTLSSNLRDRLSLENPTKLSVQKKRQLEDNIEKLKKKQFKGAYLGIKNNDIIFSNYFGYANSQTKLYFKTNTTLLIGGYQNFLDKAMLTQLIQDKKIDLEKKVTDYFPKFKVAGSSTLREFLNGNINFYIKKDKMKGSNIDVKLITRNVSGSAKDYLNVNAVIDESLLAKVDKKKYSSIFNKKIVDGMGLHDTRFYSETVTQANDAFGYSFLENNGAYVQQNIFRPEKKTLGTNELRMSVSDIVVSLQQILSNKLFDKQYNALFYKMNNSSNFGSKFDKKNYRLNLSTSGQFICGKANLSGSKLVFLISNFPAKDINNTNETAYLYKLIE